MSEADLKRTSNGRQHQLAQSRMPWLCKPTEVHALVGTEVFLNRLSEPRRIQPSPASRTSGFYVTMRNATVPKNED